MSVLTTSRSLTDLLSAPNADKTTRAWQVELWAIWPTDEQWPGVLDLYEAAAFKRVHPDTLRRQCVTDRQGRAKLKHQRIGSAFRIRKADLQNLGIVQDRSAA